MRPKFPSTLDEGRVSGVLDQAVADSSQWFRSRARNHLQANRPLEFRFEITT